jgi:hypothetical protein
VVEDEVKEDAEWKKDEEAEPVVACAGAKKEEMVFVEDADADAIFAFFFCAAV